MCLNPEERKESEEIVIWGSKLHTMEAAQKYTRADILFCVYCQNLQTIK